MDRSDARSELKISRPNPGSVKASTDSRALVNLPRDQIFQTIFRKVDLTQLRRRVSRLQPTYLLVLFRGIFIACKVNNRPFARVPAGWREKVIKKTISGDGKFPRRNRGRARAGVIGAPKTPTRARSDTQ